jgi:hypothetical protein
LLSSTSIVAQQVNRTSVAAQQADSDWSRLNSIAAGSKLSAKLKDGKTMKGKLGHVSDTVLTLMVNNKSIDLNRDEISSVYQIINKSAAKSTLIGLGIGAGSGALLGAVADASNNDGSFEKIDNVAAAGVTVIGAAAGAVTGFLIGRGSSKRVLIYEAK